MSTPIEELNESYNLIMGALTVWREARGEPIDGKRAIWAVIKNRVKAGWGATVLQVVTARYQFSCFNRDDPNVTKYPDPKDPAWLECLEAVTTNGPDITSGAKWYFNPAIAHPTWADRMIRTLSIGNHDFFREP
jgi:spore germination cell wall hydrolase CwlJ-like protein